MKWNLVTCEHFQVYSLPLGKHCNHSGISKAPGPSAMKGSVISTGWPGYSLCDHIGKLCGFVQTVAWAGEGKSSSVLDRLWWRCQAKYQGGCQVPTYISKSELVGKSGLEIQFGSVCPVDRLQGHEHGGEHKMGSMEGREKVQGLRGQKGPETLSLVKDKSHHGDSAVDRGAGGKPGECGVHRSSGLKEEGRNSCVWGWWEVKMRAEKWSLYSAVWRPVVNLSRVVPWNSGIWSLEEGWQNGREGMEIRQHFHEFWCPGKQEKSARWRR